MNNKYKLINLPDQVDGLQKVIMPLELIDKFKNNEVLLGCNLEESDKIPEDQCIDNLDLFVTRESMKNNSNYIELSNGDFKAKTMPVPLHIDPVGWANLKEIENYSDEDYPIQETTIFSYNSLKEKNAIYIEGTCVSIRWFNLWNF